MTVPPLPFRCLLTLEPLGLLHGSAGRFLSPENLTGRAAEHFPPDSPALAGLVAAQLAAQGRQHEVRDLHTAGPFWADLHQPAGLDPFLPAPLNLLQRKQLLPDGSTKRIVDSRLLPAAAGWTVPDGVTLPRKPLKGGWIRLSQWERQGDAEKIQIQGDPWAAVPHLHPRLKEEERSSAGENALFLEYGMALKGGVALAYLCSHEIPEGRYRFGGEGHLVEIRGHPVPEALSRLLALPLEGSFALITPGVWGSSRISEREPLDTSRRPAFHPWHRNGSAPVLLTDRPTPWRHRLGGGSGSSDGSRLSRGRWAVQAGSCYGLPVGRDPLPPWPDWPESWFPREGLSFRQFGTALALPLP